jgi:hypothetical protein
MDDVPVFVEADISREGAGPKPNEPIAERLVSLLGPTDLERRDIDPPHDVVLRWPGPKEIVADDWE